MPEPEPAPLPTSDLQFQTAEPSSGSSGQRCVACKQLFEGPYYHAQGHVVCPACADRIQSGQQAAPPVSLLRAALYGAGAALGGCILYATVALVTGLEIGLIAIVVGWMVGKAIRHGSNGRGGRPQQIMAVALTYFAITTSYIPVFISHAVKQERAAKQTKQTPEIVTADKPPISFGVAVGSLLLLAAVAPFLGLSSGFSAILSLFIIFIGLKQAWTLTGRTELLVMGPYDPAAPAQ